MKPVILHLRASNFLGGPERQLLGHARASQGAWYENVLASFSEGRTQVDFLEAAAAAGTRTLLLKSGGPFDPAPLRELGRFVQREPVAMLVAHGYKAAAVCDLASRVSGRPWLGVARGFTGENRRVKRYESLELRLLRQARLAVAVSQGTAAFLEARGVPAERIRTVPNSVDAQAWGPGGPGPGPGGYWVYSGRLSPEKDPSAALRALARLPLARLKVAGDGPLRAALEREARDLGIADRVEFLGFCRDVVGLYAGALALVLTSRTEGLPNVVLEALSAGLPVVATRVGGVPELIRDGETGLLVPPGDVPALAEAMARVEADPAAARDLGRRGREWVRERFGFERQRERWDAVYAEVLRSSPRVGAPIRERLKAGLKERVGSAIRKVAGQPFIFTFHRVVDLEDPLEPSASCPWISARSFEQLLQCLAQDFEVVPLAEIPGRGGAGHPCVAITFDDGWRDNAEVAGPLLKTRGMPWTLFSATGFAGTSQRSWQDRLWAGALAQFRSGEPMPAVWRGVWPPEPARSRYDLSAQCRVVVTRMKRWTPARREEMVGTLPVPEVPADAPPLYLAGEELRQLFDSGVEIGSHTHSHPLLTQLPEDEASEDIQLSTETLAHWLGRPPVSIAYPNGSVTPRVAALARDLGYHLGVTTREGRVEPGTPAMLLPRVDLTEERVVGADGRFSYDRLRFELSRVR